MSGQATSNSFHYTGRENDDGLYYYRARYYHPRLQRFISEDPMGFAGDDFNRYAYVRNNPLKYTDPLGLWRNPSDIYNDAMNDAFNSGLPGPHNGLQDAYRHCLASCEMTRENGSLIAQCLGWANEKGGDWLHNQQTGERAMDDHNNAAGVAFGGTATSTQDCRNNCMGAAKAGALRTYSAGSTPGYWR